MRTRITGITIAVALVLVLISAFVTPSPHEVRTQGSQPLNSQLVRSDPPEYFFQEVQPSQSLNDVRCAIWRATRPQDMPCPDTAALAGLYFPNLTQSPTTLFIAWPGCAYDMQADGFNVEYQPGRRAVVIHCYVARPWVWTQRQTPGAEPRAVEALLLVRTESIQAGPVSVIEDDRVEHFFRDQSTEFQLGRATIA